MLEAYVKYHISVPSPISAVLQGPRCIIDFLSVCLSFHQASPALVANQTLKLATFSKSCSNVPNERSRIFNI